MYYLLSQYFGWLAVAFFLGLFVGWLTCSDQPDRRWGWLWPALFAAAVGLILTVSGIVNGVPALWLETALLFFTFYIAGCFVGCLIRQTFFRPAAAGGVRNWHENRGEPGPRLSAAPSTVVEPGVRDWHRDLSQERDLSQGRDLSHDAVSQNVASAPVSAAAPTVAEVAEPAASEAAKPEPLTTEAAKPEPVTTEAAMLRIEGEDQIAGQRPLGLIAPRGGKADDLKLIKGIGKQNEGRLHGLGIWHFDQIAAWTKENVDWVGSYLAFPGRIEREDWVGQAKVLASGVETEFAQRVKRGEIATSKDDGSLGQDNVVTIGADGFEGVRPAGVLSAPRGGNGDDLKLINGIGRAMEQKLNALGIWHFDQIAAMNEDELRYISHHIGFPGRALRENWKEEAAILAAGGETEYSRAVKAGKIKSSLDDPDQS